MRGRWRIHGLLLALALFAASAGIPAFGQALGVTISPVVVMDTERVFAETQLGKVIVANLEDQVRALAEENQRITAELEAEEKDLTQRRPTLDPEEFRRLADAFDEKAQRIRAEQDAKLRALQRTREQEQKTFVDKIAPVVVTIARRHGAMIVLERRNAVWSSSTIDITEESIAQINAALKGQAKDMQPPTGNESGPVPPQDAQDK